MIQLIITSSLVLKNDRQAVYFDEPVMSRHQSACATVVKVCTEMPNVATDAKGVCVDERKVCANVGGVAAEEKNVCAD